MRARWLKPDFFHDRKMAELGPMGAVVFQALWVSADDGGTAPCDPDRLKGEMFFAWDAIGVPEITEALRHLAALGRVKFFQAGDELFCQVVNWKRHQFVHKPSKFRWSELYAKQGKKFAEVVPEWSSTSAESVKHQLVTPPLTDVTDSQTPRLPESQLYRDAARRVETRAESASSPAPRPTWLTPYWDAWVAAYGGKPGGGQMAKALKPLHDEHGPEKTLAHFRNYLASTEAPYASPAKFAATFGAWERPREDGRQDPRDARPGESADEFLSRMTREAPRG